MELLPRGGFRLQTEDYGVIEGRFSTASLKHYCDKKGISLIQMFESMQSGFSIEDIAEFILSAVALKMPEKHFTKEQAYDFIDDAGGVGAMNVWAGLIAHAVGGGKAEKNGEAVLSVAG